MECGTGRTFTDRRGSQGVALGHGLHISPPWAVARLLVAKAGAILQCLRSSGRASLLVSRLRVESAWLLLHRRTLATAAAPLSAHPPDGSHRGHLYFHAPIPSSGGAFLSTDGRRTAAPTVGAKGPLSCVMKRHD